jgi:hypothetical protein
MPKTTTGQTVLFIGVFIIIAVLLGFVPEVRSAEKQGQIVVTCPNDSVRSLSPHTTNYVRVKELLMRVNSLDQTPPELQKEFDGLVKKLCTENVPTITGMTKLN